MAQKITRKNLKQDKFIEATFDMGEWVEKHWKTVVTAVGAALVVVVVVALGVWWHQRSQAEVEQSLSRGLDLIGATQAGDAGNTGAARYGDALPLFEQAAKRGAGTGPGEVAAFYEGSTLLRLGRAREAVSALEGVVSKGRNAALVESARWLLAEALVAAGESDKAVALYRKIADEPAAIYPPDMALLQMGKVLSREGKAAEARQTWEDLLAKYPQSASAAEARALLQEQGSKKS